jgi:flagellar P-ring protein FlgI
MRHWPGALVLIVSAAMPVAALAQIGSALPIAGVPAAVAAGTSRTPLTTGGSDRPTGGSDRPTGGSDHRAEPIPATDGATAAPLTASVVSAAPSPGAAFSRVKDVARIVGVRDNDLYGYGIVVGLAGTGDRKQASIFTTQSLQNLLTRQGITLSPADRSTLDTKNVAAVMVTARLPAFARAGVTIDATASSIGDATSLLGGTLLLTPLQGADGQVYATAAGTVSLGGGFSVTAGGTGETAQKNHPTVGRVLGGVTVEREVPTPLVTPRLSIALLYPDFTTAARLAEAVNTALGRMLARAADSATVMVDVPGPDQARIVDFVARLEQVTLPTDAPAKVVVNERTGTVIMGHQVRLSTVAVSHGNLSITIKSELQVSQPNPFGPESSRTVTVPKTDVSVQEEKAKLALVAPGASIGDVVTALNTIGATPRDLIAILQAIKRAGALNADLEIL